MNEDTQKKNLPKGGKESNIRFATLLVNQREVE